MRYLIPDSTALNGRDMALIKLVQLHPRFSPTHTVDFWEGHLWFDKKLRIFAAMWPMNKVLDIWLPSELVRLDVLEEGLSILARSTTLGNHAEVKPPTDRKRVAKIALRIETTDARRAQDYRLDCTKIRRGSPEHMAVLETARTWYDLLISVAPHATHQFIPSSSGSRVEAPVSRTGAEGRRIKSMETGSRATASRDERGLTKRAAVGKPIAVRNKPEAEQKVVRAEREASPRSTIRSELGPRGTESLLVGMTRPASHRAYEDVAEAPEAPYSNPQSLDSTGAGDASLRRAQLLQVAALIRAVIAAIDRPVALLSRAEPGSNEIQVSRPVMSANCLHRIERLVILKESGHLSEEEFAEMKRQVVESSV